MVLAANHEPELVPSFDLPGRRGALRLRATPEALLPSSIEYTVSQCEDWNGARIVVDGISVSLKVGVSAIEVVVEGDLPAEKSKRLAEEVRMKAEAIVGSRCIVVE